MRLLEGNGNILLRRLISACAALSVSLSACAFTLVLDPGHGGKDIGAQGKITNEKTINLKVAKKVDEILRASNPAVKTVFTRSDDTFVSLQDRAKIANASGADLFVSIHVNSVDRKNRNRTSINGASVYTLGLHKSADNLAVAKRENAVMVLESDYEERYEGFNPESTESYIIFELSQATHFEQSLQVATDIQQELTTTAGRADKGVRQAGFWVLWSTGMPSVLVELDFICNPQVEEFLASDEGQQQMAESIANAISRHVLRTKKENDGTTTAEITEEHKNLFTVIFLTSAKKLHPHAGDLKGIENVYHIKAGSVHSYCTEPCNSEKEANKILADVKMKFPSAYIKKL